MKGKIVKFKSVLQGESELSRYIVIEDNGERLLIQFICNLSFKPTFVVLSAEVEVCD